MRWFWLVVVSVSLFFSAASWAERKGWQAFEHSQQAVQNKNFDVSYVVFKGDQVTSFRWLHGLTDTQQLEQLIPLDADGVDILRQDNIVYYFTPDKPALVTLSPFIKELPALFYKSIDDLSQLYDPVSGSVSQVGGRSAQLLRLTAFHPGRLNYWLWLDVETGFPIRIDTVSENQQVLERWQVTHFLLTSTLPEPLQGVLDMKLPVPDMRRLQRPDNPELVSDYQLAWLPSGFRKVDDPYFIPRLGSPLLNYWLLTDGLHQVSVFVQRSNQVPAQAYRDGATTIYVQSNEQIDITVIGPVTLDIAQQIADAVRYD
ncbi:MucB/RseB C-terminal domain-containing protein [Alkalimonas collagenimarina]|uniref:MucB/RseB C-terminal domain-containing protein n=1 Tax=Alkalimonas collagenimarina TaxID=400390 RepID=A0ABT9GWI5_9GAMM|nr:MucB/RseB C-terminal domain-containing protein [Alkalimonas collagenimarina]MDP4535412.1 MucB/RseB C-terminal domain-containing protein [Alkalimonas collagenimarina]